MKRTLCIESQPMNIHKAVNDFIDWIHGENVAAQFDKFYFIYCTPHNNVMSNIRERACFYVYKQRA